MSSQTRKLLVRDLTTHEIVGEVPITGATMRKVERVMTGLLMDMDTERFFVDDSAFDDLYQSGDTSRE